MKISLFLIACISTITLRAQYVDVITLKNGEQFEQDEDQKPIEWLNSGYVNFLTNGNLQASARLMKINIGEPGKFSIPFIIYTGTSGNNLSSETDQNENTAADLINQQGGVANFSFNGHNFLFKTGDYTSLRASYRIGGRVLNGLDSMTNDNNLFFNANINGGLIFQTGAWANDDTDNLGVFWLQAKFLFAYSSSEDVESIFGQDFTNNLTGYSVDAGLFIDKIINVKVGVSQYTNVRDIEAFKDPVVRIAIDYTFNQN